MYRRDVRASDGGEEVEPGAQKIWPGDLDVPNTARFVRPKLLFRFSHFE
jgi:hypothetical protein